MDPFTYLFLVFFVVLLLFFLGMLDEFEGYQIPRGGDRCLTGSSYNRSSFRFRTSLDVGIPRTPVKLDTTELSTGSLLFRRSTPEPHASTQFVLKSTFGSRANGEPDHSRHLVSNEE